MKVYKGSCASPGLVLGQVSRLEHHVETTTVGPFKPSRELQLLTDAIRTAQDELESMADRAAPSEQAIFQFQSMMLDDEGMMNEVRFCINAGIGAAAAMNQVGQRYADQLANMKDNPYMQLRSVDILDASRRVINIITNRPRMWLALDHPVILAAERLMPTDLFSVPSGMILGIITAEGSGQSHAAIIARAMNIPGIVQVGRDFLDDCDGRTVVLDANNGECILDPDANTRQQAVSRICELQWESEEAARISALPNRTKDDVPFELLANCYGQEDIESALQAGASGVGLLRSGYMMLPGRPVDEQEQFVFYQSCIAAAKGGVVTVRTFDFGVDRAMADIHRGLESSKLGLRGIRSSLRRPHQVEPGVAEGGHRMKHRVPESPEQPHLRAEPQSQQQRPRPLQDQRHRQNEAGPANDAPHLGCGDGLLHHPALLQTDLPAGKHKDGHRHGHHPHAPHLDQQKDHPLSER